jgi:RTX calcium-binding nonapeptide repeat (4 copies)
MLVFGLGPGTDAASAGKVSVAVGPLDPTGAVTWAVSFAADAGEANAVSTFYDAAGVTIRDDGALITSAEGCVRRSEREVSCLFPPKVRSARFEIATADGADAVAITGVGPNFVPISIDGGAGDDTLAGGVMPDNLTGGDGNDVMLGLDGSDDLRGGPGKDRFEAGPGDDRLFDAERSGGFAREELLDGGDGRDLVDYGQRTRPVRVDLTRPGQAGEGGERDQLRSIENVNGGEGGDRLFGTGAANNIDGNEGRDLIRGRAGPDLLNGGNGADRIYGGAGRDDIEADDEPDKASDRLSCGRGRDVASAPRRNDLVGASCERVSLGGDQLIRAHPVRLTRRSASFRIYCPGPDDYDPFIDEPDPCPGRLTLRAGKRKRTVGSKRYRVRFRSSRRVAVKLRRLRARPRRRVRLQVAVRDQEGEVWAYSIRARVR